MQHCRTYAINSTNRESGTDSNFAYNINIPYNKKYDKVVILAANIPKSYYLIQEGDNSFILREMDENIEIKIPPGNYNRRSFQIIIQSLLNNNSRNGWTYQISYPSSYDQPDDGKYKFEVSGNFNFQPSLIMTKDEVYEQFGFDSESINVFNQNEIYSKNVVKFQLEDVLYIHSDICVNDGNDNNTNDVLQIVYASSSNNFSNILYTCYDTEANSKNLRSQDGNLYNFSITNENNHPMNLNGLNITFTLMIYKKDDSMKMLTNFTQLMARLLTNDTSDNSNIENN